MDPLWEETHILAIPKLAPNGVKFQVHIRQSINIGTFLFFWQCFFFFSFIFISWRLITLQYCSGFCKTERDTDVQNRPLESVGEGEGGMFWQNSIKTCILSIGTFLSFFQCSWWPEKMWKSGNQHIKEKSKYCENNRLGHGFYVHLPWQNVEIRKLIHKRKTKILWKQ